jgi:hypothetical protein
MLQIQAVHKNACWCSLKEENRAVLHMAINFFLSLIFSAIYLGVLTSQYVVANHENKDGRDGAEGGHQGEKEYNFLFFLLVNFCFITLLNAGVFLNTRRFLMRNREESDRSIRSVFQRHGIKLED